MEKRATNRIRKIIHVDLDAFFCAVEEIQDPSLHGKPFAVGGSPTGRGVIASCSYAARARGVRSAMPTATALKLCPQLVILRGKYSNYSAYSRQVMDILKQYTPLIQQVSIDEAFLDVTDLPLSGYEIALEIQQRVKKELSLYCSFGVASNKLVAKVATDYGKMQKKSNTSYPASILVVQCGDEAAFLAPLPVNALWGIGPKTAEKLNQAGIKTIGELADLSNEKLNQLFGNFGSEVASRVRGIDHSQVVVDREIKSVSQEVTFNTDIQDPKLVQDTIRALSEQVAFRLRKAGLIAGTVRIKVRWSNFETHTRQVSLCEPVNQDSIIAETAIKLFDQIWQPGKRVRLIGVGTANFDSQSYQLPLWDTKAEKERRLLSAVDLIRDRYGKQMILKGSSISKDEKDKRSP